ncbi:MAG: hypothetical protein ACKVWR_02905 [Acidimicrobiales bacterium]
MRARHSTTTRLSLLGAAAAGLLALQSGQAEAISTTASPAAEATGAPAPASERLLTPIRADLPKQTKERLVAETTRGDHRFSFVEYPEIGMIGVFEQAKLGAGMMLATLPGGEQAPTPLELYLALSPDPPPNALVADHHARGELTAEPADLSAWDDGGYIGGDCAYNPAYAYDSWWAWNWDQTVGQFHDLSNQLSFLEKAGGYEGKVYDAHVSRARWLAACNGSHPHGYADIYLQPEFRAAGEWKSLSYEHVEPYTQTVFWSSNGPERWRLRIRQCQTPDYCGGPARPWAIGGAIDLPFGFTSGG